MKGRESALRVEVNPWALDNQLEEVMKLRGAYMAAMGTVETILTELAIRASKDAAYTGVREKFPSRRPARLKYLRAVCDLSGPLHRHRRLIFAIIGRFEAGLDLRDLLAHSRMQVLSGSGRDGSIKLEDYSASGDDILFRQERLSLMNFRRTVQKAARMSRAVDILYWKMGELLPLLTGELRRSP